jgi:hypothetical protein
METQEAIDQLADAIYRDRVLGTALDRAYVEDWCRRLNIIDRYRQVIATVPIL